MIRGDQDRGIIALLGSRFAEPDYAACLPEDWYRYDPRELLTDDPLPRLIAFWDGQGDVGKPLVMSES